MISKYYEIEKFKNKTNYFLFYGENEGQNRMLFKLIFPNLQKRTSTNILKKI